MVGSKPHELSAYRLVAHCLLESLCSLGFCDTMVYFPTSLPRLFSYTEVSRVFLAGRIRPPTEDVYVLLPRMQDVTLHGQWDFAEVSGSVG